MVALHFRSLTSLVALAAVGSAFGQILPTHPGPSNNGGSANWAIFFDAVSLGPALSITHLKSGNNGGAGVFFTVEVYTRDGSALGGPVGVGPGSSPAGWTLIGTAAAQQGPLANGVSELIDIPDIAVPAGQTVGVALLFRTVGPRYFGTGTPPYANYSDGTLRITTGDSRSAPFTATGSFFASRELVGEVHYTTGAGPLIEGDVDLQDWTASLAGQMVRFEITAAGGGPVLQTTDASLDGTGGYSFATALPPGFYDIYAKSSHWLRRARFGVVLSGSGVSGLNYSLFNGDCDDDNEVGIGDFAIISASFGLCVGDPGYDDRGDLNGDGCVDIGDYAIMSFNYGLLGDD